MISLDNKIALVTGAASNGIGRAVAVYRGTSSEELARCTVGLTKEAFDTDVVLEPESANRSPPPTDPALRVPVVSRTTCVFQSTGASPAGASDITGSVEFSIQPGSAGVLVRHNIIGLAPGSHGWHVHTAGDLRSVDGSSAGPHFVGTGVSRPAGVLNEVGMIGDGAPLVASSHGLSISLPVRRKSCLARPGGIVELHD